ncbi:MAG: WD40 repeat domain-containing protein [Bacteroidia bacterium]
MKYELTHDSLARQIEEMVSDEQKIRRKMLRFLQEQYARYESSQVLMNREDLDYVRPYLGSLPLNESVKVFVRKSETSVKRKGQFLAGAVSVIVLIISVLGIRAYIEGQRYQAQYLNAKARQISTTDPSMALRLEEAAYAIDDNAAIRQDMFETYRKNAFYQILLKLDGPVIAAARSVDGHQLVTVTASSPVPQIWNEKGQKTGELTGHIHPVYDVDIAGNGHIASAGNDKTAILWGEDRKPADTFVPAEGDQAADIRSVAISPAGTHVVSGASDGKVSIWLTGKQQPIFELNAQMEITCVAIHPHAASFAVAGNMHDIIYGYFTESGWETARFSMPGDAIQKLAYSPDGKYLSSGDGSGKILLWEVGYDSIKWLKQVGQHRSAVHALAFSPDSRWLVSGSADSTAVLWPMNAGRPVRLLGHTGEIRSVSIGADNLMMTAGLDSTVRIWNMPDPPPFFETETHGRGVSALAFSPDGQRIVTGGRDQMVSLIDPVNSKFLWTHQHHREQILAVAIFPDGRVGSVDEYGSVVRVDAENKAIDREFQAGEIALLSAAFSPDGQWLLTGGTDSTARLWNIDTGEESLVLPHQGLVFSVAFNPDGNYFLTGCEDSSAYLWDKTGKKVQVLSGHKGEVLSVGFTPSTGRILTGCQDQKIRLWDKGGKLFRVFGDLAKPVNTVAVNPGETLLLVGYKDERVVMYDLEGYAIADISGHKNIVNKVAFTPDGKWIATASDDKYLRVWNDFRMPLADFLNEGILNILDTHIRKQYDIK